MVKELCVGPCLQARLRAAARQRPRLCSQPDAVAAESAPRLEDVNRMTYAAVDRRAGISATAATFRMGHEQLSRFNAHYDERCFLPIHVYDTEKRVPVAVILCPGKTPLGIEVRSHLRRLVRRIRRAGRRRDFQRR